jgi:hypothetical protein
LVIKEYTTTIGNETTIEDMTGGCFICGTTGGCLNPGDDLNGALSVALYNDERNFVFKQSGVTNQPELSI